MLVTPVLMRKQKNGPIQFTESCEQLMNNFIADSQKMSPPDWDAISRNLKVQLRADSSGNWELILLTDWALPPSKIASVEAPR